MELVRVFIGRLSDTIERIQCLIPLRESSEHYNSDEVSFTRALTIRVHGDWKQGFDMTIMSDGARSWLHRSAIGYY